MSLSVEAIPNLSDNYAWLLRDAATGTVAIVDPAEEAPCARAIDAAGGRCDLILITHHHDDHTGGVAGLVARYGAKVVGAAADAHRLPKLDQAVKEGDTVAVGASTARVIDTPGHTRGHIAYFFPEAKVLVAGDTLFSLGCGRFLEGTAEEMFTSLRKLAALPPETMVTCGHEYSESNARFALSVEPDNAALKARAAEIAAARAAGRATVPFRLGDDLAANPFLRAPDAAALGRLREGKNNFRG